MGEIKLMNEPIINPWIFYILQIVDTLIIISVSVLVISLLLMGTMFIMILLMNADDEYKDIAKAAKKQFKRVLALTMFSSIMVIFIPSSDTIYKMLIADNLTPNNIQAIGGTLEDSIDYIAEKIKDLNLNTDEINDTSEK